MAPPKLTRKALEERLRAEFPEMFNAESGYTLEKLWFGGCPGRAGTITRGRCARAARSPARP